MNRMFKTGICGLALVVVAGLLASCGGDTGKDKGKEADKAPSRGVHPFMALKLKNSGPKPAKATASGTLGPTRVPSQSHATGTAPAGTPAAPGNAMSSPTGTEDADTVTVKMIITGGPTLTGNGAAPAGTFIETVEVEGNEGAATATLTFYTGATQVVPLH